MPPNDPWQGNDSYLVILFSDFRQKDMFYKDSAKEREFYNRTVIDWLGRWFKVLFIGSNTPETFIGPPWLERETRIRESPVRVPTGTTAGPQG